jgi:putative tryptophan/tyrosine transport system substrate-binding protein
MRRKVLRVLSLILTLGSIGVPLSLKAQQAARVHRIGRLAPLSAEADAPSLDAFREAMRSLGWIEGGNYAIEARFADGRAERLNELAADLVRQRVDMILSGSSPGALAAKRATSTIPIVMVTTGDPVGGGIVASLARPGGNITGVTTLGHGLYAKRLELLKQAVPGLTRVAIVANPRSADAARFLEEKDSTAKALGLELKVLHVRDPAEAERVLSSARDEHAGAWMFLSDVMLQTNRRRFVDLVAKSGLPAVYPDREFVEAGGLMFYGASLVEMYKQAGSYADRILKGAKPADLPIEQPTKLELVINLKTAKALGLAIPQSVLVRADELIQ